MSSSSFSTKKSVSDVFHSRFQSPNSPSSSQTKLINDEFHSYSSSSQTKWKHDVFFSCMDCFQHARSGFRYHLLCSLQSAGLDVYRDVYGIRKELLQTYGFSFTPLISNGGSSLLLKIIEGCRVSIIIFSCDFASSRWCLEELDKIMECHTTIGQIVLPVFYNVEPWEVGQQRGTFGDAFQELLKRVSATKDKLKRWSRALTKAAELEGWNLTDSLRDEIELIDSIRETIKIRVESTQLFIAEHPVGIKSRVQCITHLLAAGSNVIMVGLWGMAGIGKTTLAKAVYNEIAHEFEGSCFLSNISNVWKQGNGEAHLKQQLLREIFNTRDMIWHHAKMEEITKLGHKKALIVFDDVDRLEQLEALCGSEEPFGPGSRIIITTRDKDLLHAFRVEHIYKIKELDDDESLDLFCWHAFGVLFRYFRGKDLISSLKGHPLAIEILGSNIPRNTSWELFSNLRSVIPDNKLHDIPKFCYDGLDKSLKDLFLDTCCFFIGKDRSYVTQILNDRGLCGEMLIRSLLELKLITIDQKNKLGMHAMLQEMGQEIIRKREKTKWTYNVFLSFGGKETRRSFVSHLFATLTNHCVKVFMDDKKLERGENISTSLMRAIESSRFSVVVFSTSYAHSKWCLAELEKIMECHRYMNQEVLPIFYDVDPSEVRHQRGNFGEAFQKLIKRTSANEYKITSWKRALTEAANLSGWDSRSYSTDVELIDDILETITTKLDDNLLFVAEHPVGVEFRAKGMITQLSCKSNDVLMIGLLGMGGIGKTTTAKAIYNEIGRHFETKCFLANIRETWEKEHGKVDLQEQLLSNILKSRRMKLHDIDYGKILVKEILVHKKSLLVLDDVNEVDQLRALCGSGKWLAPGSRLIITTRNEHILNFLKVKDVYRIEPLDQRESLELFSWHAFKQNCPDDKFNLLSRDVVAYCGGLPLALEILGSFFFGRGVSEWESALMKLKRIPHNQIKEKLKISFDGLSDNIEKEIFLHISCFFIGMDRNYVTQLLDDCGLHAQIGISILKERSLIIVNNKNKLGMHNLLRDMGRDIIREESLNVPGERSRLFWHDEVLDVLRKYTGTKAVEGLALNMPRTNKICLSTKAFKKMKRLRLLQLGHIQLDGNYEYLSRDLRWLCWHGFLLQFLPTSFYQESLIALDLKYSNLKLLWKKPKLLEKLKILNLSHSDKLIQTPDFSKLPNLEKLILKDCPSLSIVHHTIGDLHKLYLVNLKDCTSIVELPRSIYKLKRLKTLILSGCSKIDKLEDDFEQMDSLTALLADNTAITQVPFSIVRSKSIGYISLCGHEGLSEDVFPSIIWSWMSPMNSAQSIGTFGAMSSLVSIGLENNNFCGRPAILNDQPNFRSLWLHCFSKNLTQDITRILEALSAPSCTISEPATNASQITLVETSALIDGQNQVHSSGLGNSLNSLLFQMGVCNEVIDTLRESILQIPPFLPSDNYPQWLSYTGEGSSISFKVPDVTGCALKGITLYILYSSNCMGNKASEYVPYVLIINQTKSIIQLHKKGSVTTFKDEEWQHMISNLESGDEVMVIVVFGDRVNVKSTIVYLVFGESMEKKEPLL